MGDTLEASRLKPLILEILANAQDLTVATLRPDGWPQATTVSYASDGLAIYVGCGAASQKARNLALDDRVSLTVNLPYKDWSQIRGVSAAGRAERLTDPDDTWRAAALFVKKFPEVAQSTVSDGEVAFFRIRLEVISVLDYAKGFGHTDLVRADEL